MTAPRRLRGTSSRPVVDASHGRLAQPPLPRIERPRRSPGSAMAPDGRASMIARQERLRCGGDRVRRLLRTSVSPRPDHRRRRPPAGARHRVRTLMRSRRRPMLLSVSAARAHPRRARGASSVQDLEGALEEVDERVCKSATRCRRPPGVQGRTQTCLVTGHDGVRGGQAVAVARPCSRHPWRHRQHLRPRVSGRPDRVSTQGVLNACWNPF